MKKYFAWAKPKKSSSPFVQTYINAINIKEARIKFEADFEVDGKVSPSKHQ